MNKKRPVILIVGMILITVCMIAAIYFDSINATNRANSKNYIACVKNNQHEVCMKSFGYDKYSTSNSPDHLSD
jgi:hypothetical protein